MSWTPILQFPIEWAALSLLVMGCLYWERSGFSGLGVEGCVAAAMIGLIVGYQETGDYALACVIAAGGAAAFALITGTLVHLLRADPAVGSLALSLVPACALGLIARAGPNQLLTQTPPPGLIPGTILEGTYAEDLLANPWLLASPAILGAAGWILWHTPFGLRVRAFGENPAWRAPGARPSAYRMGALALGALWTVPAAALLLRAHPGAPPVALGIVALACAIAGRWTVLAGILLAAGPALVRAASPYGVGSAAASILLDMGPCLLALLYLVFLSRRALRLSAPPKARTDPDVL